MSIARAAANLLGVISTIVLARLLLPADFGLVALATTMLAILSAVTDLSLANALIHHENPTDDHYHTAWSLDFVRGLGVAAIFCVAAYPTAIVYQEPRIIGVMIVLGVATALNGLANPKMVAFLRDLDFRQNFALTVVSKFVGFLVSIGVAVVFRNYWALVLGFVSTQLATIAVSYLLFPYRPRFVWSHARELWSFSIWLTLGQIINTINWKFDQLLVGGFLGRAELGFYTVGDNLAAMPTREATAPLAPTLFPAFTRFRNDIEKLRDAYQKAQTTTTAVALPVGVGVALVAAPLVHLTMGEKWDGAIIIIQILSSVFALQTLSATVQPLAMALGQTRRLFYRDTISFILRLPTIVIGLYLGGLSGLVYARAITGVLAIFLNLWLVKEMIGLTLWTQLSANFRSVVSCLIMAAAVSGVAIAIGVNGDSWHLAFAILAMAGSGLVTYLAATFAMWVAARRPSGPESFAMEHISRLMVRRTSQTTAA